MKLKLFVLVSALGLAGCPQEAPKSGPAPVNPAASQPGQQAQAAQPAQPSQPAQPAQPTQAGDTATAQQAAPAAGPDEGKKLYMMGCANCHGADGTGQLMRQMYPKIGDLTSPELHTRLKDADLTALITNGRDKMPPFGSVFKPEQIQAIIGYVRTMKKG